MYVFNSKIIRYSVHVQHRTAEGIEKIQMLKYNKVKT